MSNQRKPPVLLTPLAINDGQGHFVCIAIRDPDTEEIIETVVTSYDLAEKVGIALDEAQNIFESARIAAERHFSTRTSPKAA